MGSTESLNGAGATASPDDDTNAVILTGTLLECPALKYTQAGTAIATLRLEVRRTVPASQHREARVETPAIEVTTWGRQAEACANHLAAGATALIEGRLDLDTWEGKDGTLRERLKVTAFRVHFLAKAPGAQQAAPTTASTPPDDDVPF